MLRPFGKNGFMVICGSRSRPPRCLYCRREGTRLCDFQLPGGKTCDRRMCARCTWSPTAEEDYCPEHHAAKVKP